MTGQHSDEAMWFHHVGISVSDLERSVEFYRDMLKMTCAHEPFEMHNEDAFRVMGLKDVTVRQAVMEKGTLRLELFEFGSPTPKRQAIDRPVSDHGITHFGVDMDGLDEAYEFMSSRGVTFHYPVTEFPGGIKAAYGRDPDGNVFELLQIPEHRRERAAA